jgi:hypothetical protein
MRNSKWLWLCAFAVAVTMSSAGRLCAQIRTPFQVLDEEPENVYVEPVAGLPPEQTNQGGMHFSLDTTYFTTYMYRGVDQSTAPIHNEHALQFDGRLTFDLGKFPHPFVGVFSNIFNNDKVSRFEEVRPYAGLEWTIRPITLATGFTGYIFPNREGIDTQEVWAKISADDSRFFHTEHPFLSPYVYAAYDFNKYKGFYIEAGIKHDFPIGDTGVIISAVGDFAYIAHNSYFRRPGPLGAETGFQHYDIGSILTYDLDPLLHIPTRFGHWEIKGYLYYTGPVEEGIRADSRIWGGAGLSFNY